MTEVIHIFQWHKAKRILYVTKYQGWLSVTRKIYPSFWCQMPIHFFYFDFW